MTGERAWTAQEIREAWQEGADSDYPLESLLESLEAMPDRVVEHVNGKLRQSIVKGQTLLQMMDSDLEAAWVAHTSAAPEKKPQIRGRIRGLAQAITTVRSPFSRNNLGADSRRWSEAIKATEEEALRRCKAKGVL